MTAIVKAAAVSPLQTFLRAREKSLASYAASRVKPDTLIRLALFEFANNDYLRRCTPETIYHSLITAAQLGLEIGAAKGEAYLVPYNGRCQLIPGYRGLIKLALRSKAVRAVYAHAVHSADDFSIELGSDPRVVHRPALHEDRGEVIGCYAVAQLASGAVDVEWMSVAELDRIRAASKASKGGPWEAHTDEMRRKTVIRRLAKRLPMGDDFFQASHADDLAEQGKDVRLDLADAPSDAEIVEQPNSLREKIKAAADEVQA